MMETGRERPGCVTQKWVTGYVMCHTWPRSDTGARLKHSQSGSRNVHRSYMGLR